MASKKAAKKTVNRGRRPEPYTVGELRNQGDSVLHMSKRVRTLLGTAIGGALGAVVGQLAAEDPEKFGNVVTSIMSAFNGGGIMGSSMPPTGGKKWYEKRSAAVWHIDVADGVAHAYELAFDGAPGASACEVSKMRALDPVTLFMAGKAERCNRCVKILQEHGYDTKIPGSAAAPPWTPGEPVVTPPPATPCPDITLDNLCAHLDSAKENEIERWSVRNRKTGKLVVRANLIFIPSEQRWYVEHGLLDDEKKQEIVMRLATERNALYGTPATH